LQGDPRFQKLVADLAPNRFSFCAGCSFRPQELQACP